MILRTVEIDSEEHAKEFDELVKKLDYVKVAKHAQKFSVQDAALGINRMPNEDELSAFFTEDEDDQILIHSKDVFSKYKA